jgi:glycosyltransferase involved in cell wall biosynthesis
VPYLPGKYLETVSHAGMSALDGMLRGYDVIWLGNAATAVFAGLPRLRGTAVVLNVDGIERQRSKWGLAGRLWYALGERAALVLPSEVVSDARVIQTYYRERYGRETPMITYGAPLLDRLPQPDLSRHGLRGIEPERYILYVSRLEPENQADLVIEAYREVPGDLPLLIVGNAPYAAEFRARVHELAARDPRVHLPGAIYGEGYRDLQRAALAYVQATSVGGTHPALVEAMGAGNLVLAFGTPENVEVAGDVGLIFRDRAELAEALTRVVTDPHAGDLDALRAAARAKAESTYSWDAVTSAYEDLFEQVVQRR